MDRNEYQKLQKEIDDHWRKRPQNQYKLEGNGYTDEYIAWDEERYRLNNLMVKENTRLYAEQRAAECKVLSHIHVPKGLAVKLALFGFNEKCYRTYYKRHQGLKKPMRFPHQNYYDGFDTHYKEDLGEDRKEPYELTSPTYDQVALWFTENYHIDFISSPEEGREKQYRCDPVSPELGLVNLPFCDSAKEAQLQAFYHLLTKLTPLPRKLQKGSEEEEDNSFVDSETGEKVHVDN